MSEIFDFLKKTESERRKESPVPEQMNAVPVAEFGNDNTQPKEEPRVFEEPAPAEVEIVKTDSFDLSASSSQILSVLDPRTLVGEQFRLLRSKLSIMQKQRGIKTILVTSTVPEEGKTFTAFGLAGVMAQEPGKRVVLIDADMRKAGSGGEYGLNGSIGISGLSEVLRGDVEFRKALITSKNPELYFLSSGPLPSNPSELLSTPKMEKILKEASELFDWIVIDSPPILSLVDATQIAHLCHAVLLVVRANSTPSKLVQEAANRVGRERICGLVMNRQKYNHSSRYYYGYYKSGSKHSKK
jgi:capsular exopolysaccharide synthesis family protein